MMNPNPKILIYGAGVIGSIFAGMIAKAGFDVTVLARGKRYTELTQNGLILVNSLSNQRLQINRLARSYETVKRMILAITEQ